MCREHGLESDKDWDGVSVDKVLCSGVSEEGIFRESCHARGVMQEKERTR